MAHPARSCLLLLLATWPLAAEPAAAPPSPAVRAWQLGQLAMERDDLDGAIAQYHLSLRLDPTLAQSHLSLAAAHLARGEDAVAAGHLARYLAARPQHLIVRAHYAELLIRLGRPREARAQYERFTADIQDTPLGDEQLVHGHSRLMELAEGQDDDYSAHLNRGIGLYWLARRPAAREAGGELCEESLLCRAAAELVLARRARPDEARPCWYLCQVWARLGQRQPATRWLRAARDAALLSDLTPAERRGLHLAWSGLAAAPRK
jgi:Tfp pilus assembly protein PilF